MHSRWIEAGGDPDRFWRLTPGELKRESQAMIGRLKADRAFEAWKVWNTAALGRADPKKAPSLPDFMRMARGEQRKQQTPEQQLAIARRWHAIINRGKN